MSQGYIQEVFSSFQGEGASVEGSCYGLRQIFVRLAGCPLALGVHGTNGCIWCDSPKSWSTRPKKCLVETKPGSQKFDKTENPLNPDDVVNIIKNLTTTDLHSISFTGGEPLFQELFLEETINLLRLNNYKIYLETAFTDNFEFLKKIAKSIDYACVDVKDRTAEAALNWEKLIEQEFLMCKTLKNAGTKIYAKTVITKASKKEDFEILAKRCGEIGVPLVIQFVSPPSGSNIEKPTWEQINNFTIVAGEYLPADKIGVSIQMHKAIEIL